MAAPSNGFPQNGHRTEAGPAPRYVEGVILLDFNFRVLAFDEGATAILKDSGQSGDEARQTLQVPQELLDVIQNGYPSDSPSRRFRIQLGTHAYICRIHVALSHDEGLPGRFTVLHLARDVTMDDALAQIRAEYRLTLREQQALRGVLLGLTSKEVAEQMNISPNTVKAFLRLVMGKMGVSSRTGIVAKLFEPNGHG